MNEFYIKSLNSFSHVVHESFSYGKMFVSFNFLFCFCFYYFAFVSRKFSDEIPPDILNPSIAICRAAEDLLKILQKKSLIWNNVKLN